MISSDELAEVIPGCSRFRFGKDTVVHLKKAFKENTYPDQDELARLASRIPRV